MISSVQLSLVLIWKCIISRDLISSFVVLNYFYFVAAGAVQIQYSEQEQLIRTENGFAYQLTWKMPCFPNGNITSYRIIVNGVYSENASLVHSFEKSVTALPLSENYTSVLEPLKYSYGYNIKIAAISGSLIGNWTSYNITTPVGGRYFVFYKKWTERNSNQKCDVTFLYHCMWFTLFCHKGWVIMNVEIVTYQHTVELNAQNTPKWTQG